MISSFSKYYSFRDLVGTSSGVGDGDIKGRVGPRTIHIISHKVGCCIDVGTFLSSHSNNINS